MARKSFATRFAMNSSIARNVNGWKSTFQLEYGPDNHCEKVAVWLDFRGVMVCRCDLYEPTENTEQAFELMREWELLGENKEFMLKAADMLSEDEITTDDDRHSFTRLQICLAVLSCASMICDQDFIEDDDYAF